MLTSTKSKFFISFEYIFIFIVTSLVFFFMIPQADVFDFAYDFGNSLSEILNASIFYGNGRLFGNLLGIFFSHNFSASFALVSFTITLIIILTNYIMFDNNKYAVLPISLILLFPSSIMMSEVYFLLATFCNFVPPIVFVLFSLAAMKYLHNHSVSRISNIILSLFIGISTLSSCLFNENTSIVVFILALVILFVAIKLEKQFHTYQIINVITAFLGLVLIFFLPRFLGTAQKMNEYRSVTFNLRNILLKLVSFSDIIINQTMIIILISLALLYLCIRKSKLNKSIKVVFVSYFSTFPVFSIIIQGFRVESYSLPRTGLSAFVAVTLFFIFSLITIFSIKNDQLRYRYVLYGVLLSSSIAPIMFVSLQGYRLYYATVIIMIFFTLSCFKLAYKDIKQKSCNFDFTNIIKYVCVSSILVFSLLCSAVFIQTVYNFRFYIYRTDMLQEQIEDDSTIKNNATIEAFDLPCQAIIMEDEYHYTPFLIIKNKINPNYEAKNISVYNYTTAKYEDIDNIRTSNLLNLILYNLNHLEYKNPLILQDK